ncbi:FKBP-type peptidyl-prolyl cis-trans isomerase [Catellatospora tritici]|uniref:FKBP-type peptidyl-prolyl cis-trans isomerase n=1 Tax=Catellatospora tritici TaxID=2851566 RepID=UPI001C2D8F74|nr:FKBP-type peptidyl-prolyl cis-trans isomerase [Catellatospora tritici]MBV1852963.1 FKBP-type peptidyl-prolyl cis-trans isomerase [Catellatospora tritici]
MSEQVKEKHVGPSAARRATKAQRREERMAVAKAAARRKRILSVIGAIAGLVLMVGFAYLVFPTNNKPDNGNLSSVSGDGTTQDPGAQPDPNAQQPTGEFPPLPEGADPALKTKPAATKGEGDLTKLSPKVLIEGKGAAVKSGDHITVNYVGVSYKTGEEFDASWGRQQAFDFTIGQGAVIQGWDQGLLGIKVGSRVQLDIPSEMAYGDNGQVPGPLRFIVDILKIG